MVGEQTWQQQQQGLLMQSLRLCAIVFGSNCAPRWVRAAACPLIVRVCALSVCRWGEVSGKHIDLQVGDICDWEFLSQAFTVRRWSIITQAISKMHGFQV
jgi:hypothetical protein